MLYAFQNRQRRLPQSADHRCAEGVKTCFSTSDSFGASRIALVRFPLKLMMTLQAHRAINTYIQWFGVLLRLSSKRCKNTLYKLYRLYSRLRLQRVYQSRNEAIGTFFCGEGGGERDDNVDNHILVVHSLSYCSLDFNSCMNNLSHVKYPSCGRFRASDARADFHLWRS